MKDEIEEEYELYEEMKRVKIIFNGIEEEYELCKGLKDYIQCEMQLKSENKTLVPVRDYFERDKNDGEFRIQKLAKQLGDAWVWSDMISETEAATVSIDTCSVYNDKQWRVHDSLVRLK